MSELRDRYLGLGHDPDYLDCSGWYLSELAINSAIEIDDSIIGKGTGFSHVMEFKGILDRYQLRDSDDAVSKPPGFPYLAFFNVLKKGKDIGQMSEVAVEMRLLRYELDCIEEMDRDGLEGMRSLFLDLSKEISSEEGYRMGLAANL
jgi:hypothetical protein